MSNNVMNLSDEEFNKLPEVTEDTQIGEEENNNSSELENTSVEENLEDISEEDNETLEEKQDEEEEIPSKENTTTDKTDNKDINQEEDSSKETIDKDSELNKYKETCDLIFKPFKANGKEIQARTPEEVIKLMQMGANYTRKMQTLQPHLKVVKMLENNNLLDEEKLNYLIDIDKKNPEAIKKLLKDSEIDPLSIDIDQETSYKPNNYSVSQNKLVLEDIVKEYDNDPDAENVFKHILDNWDDESRKAIYRDPNILNSLVEQKRSGLFDRIVSEIDRQKTFGNQNIINIPFAQAYLLVGQAIDAQDAINMQNSGHNTAKTLVDTKALVPEKNISDNSTKVKAASIARNSSTKKVKLNIHEMSDDDFLKSDFAKNL